MSELEAWLSKWKIKINTDKSTAAIFTKRRQTPRNRLKNVEAEITWPRTVRYLGPHLEKITT
jgi:hypothetical protein